MAGEYYCLSTRPLALMPVALLYIAFHLICDFQNFASVFTLMAEIINCKTLHTYIVTLEITLCNSLLQPCLQSNTGQHIDV